MTALVCESAEAKQQLLKQETCDITLEALRLLCHATVKTPPKKVAPPYDWTQNMALSMVSLMVARQQ